MQSLIIGDMNGHAGDTASRLHSSGVTVATSTDIGAAIHHLRKVGKCDFALIDSNLDIRKFLSQLQVERLSLHIIACGASATAKKKAKSLGVQDYLALPATDKDMAEILRLSNPDDAQTQGMIAEAPCMLQLLAEAEKFAKTKAHIFISGETGCGKEVLANYIYKHSPRAKNKFIAVNCAAIVETLMESELFGHEKGAFTGADTERKGKFELADKGTLLLDEISEMDYNLQAKLLRAIQESKIDRVGGSVPIDIDIRIIATSNRDILAEVQEGRFREDLYYRLSVMPLNIPPLRERKEDIGKLANYFVEKYSAEYGYPYQPIADSALQRLQDYNYPGNVRELENIIHRAVIMAEGNSIIANLIDFKNFKFL